MLDEQLLRPVDFFLVQGALQCGEQYVESSSAAGWGSRLLWSLAGSELGLDRGAADIPFSLQYRPSDLPLRPSLSRPKIQEPGLRDGNNVQHSRSYHRLLCSIRA